MHGRKNIKEQSFVSTQLLYVPCVMSANEMEYNLFQKPVRIISIIVSDINLPEEHCWVTINIYIQVTVIQLQNRTQNALLFPLQNGYANAPQCHLIPTVFILFGITNETIDSSKL